MNNEYFATLEPDALANELTSKVDNWLQWCMVTGRLGRWRTAFDSYYGQRDKHKSYYITQAGEQGELSMLMANEYRNLIQHVLVMTTQNKPSFEVSCTNTDSRSQEQGILAKNLLDYYWSLGGITDVVNQALEASLVMDSSWVFTEWDVTKGEKVRPGPDGRMITTGDIQCSFKQPIDVVVDWTRESAQGHTWQIKSDLVNKYDLAAQFPEKGEDIIKINRDLTKDSIYRFGDQGIYTYNSSNSPLIRRWTFYHAKSPSMPEGRMFQFLDGKIWLFDGPIPYKNLPGRRICPSEMMVSTMGYSSMNDLLALQDSLDALVSAAVTNMTTCGVNNVWAKPNSNINFERLGEGMNFIESEEKPEVLVMNRLSPEWFSLTQFIIQRMEAYSGINSISRGNTEGKDLSGAAMALLQSMAISFNSGMQRAYNKALEDIGNDIVTNLQEFADEQMTAMIAGSHDKYMVKNFTKKDIDAIKRVFIKQSNSIQDTAAGKLTLFDNLAKIPNAITRPEQAIQVMTTGRLEPVYEDRQKELLAIKEEAEALARGENPQVVFSENHPLHIDQHRYIILDPDTKKDPKVLQAVSQHINQHIQVWSQTDPIILQAMNIPPFPAPQMGPPGQGAPPQEGQQPPQERPNPGGQPIKTQGQVPMPNEAGGPEGPNMPNQPSMPTNPLTKKQFDPQTGGL